MSQVKNDPKQSQQAKGEPKEKQKASEVLQLLRLTKPELPTLATAMLLLCLSSAVSMFFPVIMGKVIDTAKDDEDSSNTELTTVLGIPMPKTIKVLNYDIPTSTCYLGIVVVFFAGACANFGRIVLLRKVGERIMMNLRINILRKIFYQNAKFWDYHKSGDLISRLVNDSTVVARSITQNVSDGLRSLISGFVGMTMMLMISAKLTAYMLLVFPVILFIALVFGRRVKNVSRKIQQQMGSLTKVSEEQFSLVNTIQAFNNEEYEVGKFGKEVKKLYDLSVFEGKLNGVFYGSNGFVGNTFLLFMLTMGTYMVRQGEMSLGELSSYLMYTIYAASSVYSLSNFYSELMKGVGASSRVFELLHLKASIDPKAGKPADVDGDIKFSDIDFRYPTRPHHVVFDKLDLEIPKGDHVCFVGPSGCGKSTVTQLLLRCYPPLAGTITANDNRISDVMLADYRHQVGVVEQEPKLFSGTIRDNIVYGRRDAPDADVNRVARLAYCDTFINSFPDGMDTVIGSKGAQLSGGQKQRIALARALLLGAKVPLEVQKNLAGLDVFDEEAPDHVLLGPSILILDEATSALDAHSEEAIQRTLQLREKAKLSTISVAHRLSTIQMCRRIVVFSGKGEILEQGSYNGLIQNPDSALNHLLQKGSTPGDVEEELTEREKEQEETGETEDPEEAAEKPKPL